MTQNLVFKQRLQRGWKKEQRAQEDRAVRQNENEYERRGYGDESVERNAGIDAEIARRLRNKRNLKGVDLGEPF